MQVFISYARQDGQDLAQQLYRDLKGKNVTTWMDLPEMSPGKSWERQIENAIRKSAYILLVVTPEAFKSEIVQDEIAFANQHRTSIIPLYYKNVSEFPLRLLRLHYIDFRQPDLYQESFQNLYSYIQTSNFSNLPIILGSISLPYRNYLQSLIGHLRDLPIERINPNTDHSITMDEIWTPIDVDYRESGKANTIRLPALEAISTQHQLLILGDPGSGKSTLLRYTALCLASATLQNPNLSSLDISNINPTWRRGLLCPIYIEISNFAGYLLKNHKKEQILTFILEQAETMSEGIGEELRKKTLNGDCIILLDGLDEIPNRNQCEESVLNALLDFARSHASCPIVVTSRTYAYRQSSLRLSLFKEVVIAPFTDDQIDTFLEKWYNNLPSYSEMQKKQRYKLKDSIEKDPAGLGELAQQPLLLTFLASVYTSARSSLPTSKSELYEHIIQLMLKGWKTTQTVTDSERGQPMQIPSSLAEFLGSPESYRLIHHVLQEMAYNVHLRQISLEEPASINVGEVAQRLHMLTRQDKKSHFDINPYWIEEDINARTGLLQPHGRDSYRFPHRTLQEYLAACYLCRKEHYPYRIRDLIYEDPIRWQEVLMFVADITLEHLGAPCILPLLDALITKQNNVISNKESENIQLAFHYVGVIITSHSLQSTKTNLWSSLIKETREGIKSLIALQAFSPAIRAQAGHSLAIIGDNRPGVGLRSDGSPDIAWCYIPAGEFIFGDKDGSDTYLLYLPDFWISRYPVTNIQFQLFVDDLGYTEQWHECWTSTGWEWHRRPGRRQPLNLVLPFSLDNYPRVGVDFFEAYAYTRWLSKKLRFEVRLPSEPEWEKAARGPSGQQYSWGKMFDPNAANILTAQINSTCAVGLFPPSIYEVYDLIGNVSEWCITLWDPQYGYPLENMDNDPEGQYQRIVRGAAYTHNPQKATTTYRHWEDPQNRKLIQGFRLVTTSKPR